MRPLIGVSAAILLAASPAAAEETAEAIYESFLAEHGGDLDACFEGLPPLAGIDPADFSRAEPEPPPLRRLVIALDGSGSMAGSVGATRKMDAAQAAAIAFLDTVPEDVEVGMIAFGHTGNNQESGRTESCAGVAMVSPIAAGNRAELAAALVEVSATGWTPLAAAIEAAGAALLAAEGVGEQVVYIVSDGKETCGGDPVAAARALQEGPVKAIVNIIGFDLADEDRAQLAAVAAAGGGVFEEALGEDLADAIAEAGERLSRTVAVAGKTSEGVVTMHDNTMVTTVAVAGLNMCVARASSREKMTLMTAIGRDADREAREQVRTLLDRRHASADERRRAYMAAAGAAASAENEGITDAIGTTRQNAQDN